EFITNLGNCHAGTLLLDTDASDATYEDRLVCQLGAGSYSVEELTQAGWATSVSCAGTGIVATPFTQDDGSGVGVDFGLDDGADATCTFTNARTGTIVVQKDVEGGTDSQNFGFTDNVPAPCVIGTLDDDPSSPTPDSVTCSNVPI